MKRALITGITGQDGSYLAEFLLKKSYEVHGLIRRSSTSNTDRLDTLLSDPKYRKRLTLHFGDLSDSGDITRVVKKVMPDEIYNLAAQSHVRVSFDIPEYTANVTGLGTLRLLEAMRSHCPKARFYQASSSEMFGAAPAPQSESTPFYPRSPYGCAKVYSYWICKNYRESYGLHVSNGILFNHESPRRGDTFVTKKITKGLADIRRGALETLHLGNLDAKRDWGYAKDFVEGMWLMLQQKEADDYVLATGETHSVRDFINEAAPIAGFDLLWKGKGLKEVGIDRKTGKTIISIDPQFFRPAEVNVLLGNYTKARKTLGWRPQTTFKKLVEIMVKDDLESAEYRTQRTTKTKTKKK